MLCIVLAPPTSPHTPNLLHKSSNITIIINLFLQIAPTLEPQLSSLITDEGVGAIGVCVVGGSATVSAVLITPGIYDDATGD